MRLNDIIIRELTWYGDQEARDHAAREDCKLRFIVEAFFPLYLFFTPEEG